MKGISDKLQLDKENIINIMIERVQEPELTYSYRIEEVVKKAGYINAYMALAKKYKEEANNNVELTETYSKVHQWL